MSEDDRRPAAHDAAQVAETLAQVRVAVRQQQALAATVPTHALRLFARLEAVHAAQALAEPVPQSHRGWIGRPVSLVKQIVYSLFTKWYLQPLVQRQNAFNHAVALALQELADRQFELARAQAGEAEAREVPGPDTSAGRA